MRGGKGASASNGRDSAMANDARRSVVAHPSPPLRGSVDVPGDKSISHRLAMLCSLADGESELTGMLESEDCLHTLDAVAALGAGVRREGDRLFVRGAPDGFREAAGDLDMGNAGTGMRLMTGFLAGAGIGARLIGDASLSRRPMGRIRDPLAQMGADLVLEGEGDRPPIRIRPARLRGIRYPLPVASAQVKSCVLLASLFAEGETVVIEPRETRDHTERLMRAMGLPIRADGLTIRMPCPNGTFRPPARAWRVPADFSSAAFWIVAAAARPGAEVDLAGIGLNPRRTALLDVLRRMGADLDVEEQRDGASCEPIGRIRVRGRTLRGCAIGGDEIPNLIDELPLAAVAGALAEGVTEIRDAAELRVKESDRIAVMCRNLQRVGVAVEERSDGMIVSGGCALHGSEDVDSHGDHRVAMAMAVLAINGREPVRIGDTACTATSYPGFWEHLKQLGGSRE
jgi:3-phosphoshikimate 1-carboxyvinyltransferase